MQCEKWHSTQCCRIIERISLNIMSTCYTKNRKFCFCTSADFLQLLSSCVRSIIIEDNRSDDSYVHICTLDYLGPLLLLDIFNCPGCTIRPVLLSWMHNLDLVTGYVDPSWMSTMYIVHLSWTGFPAWVTRCDYLGCTLRLGLRDAGL